MNEEVRNSDAFRLAIGGRRIVPNPARDAGKTESRSNSQYAKENRQIGINRRTRAK